MSRAGARGSAPAADGVDRAHAPAPGPLRPFHFPPVRRATLSNGLEVVTAGSHGLPVATLDLILPAGGLAEREERGGLASFTVGLLESGAGERDAAALAEHVDALGLSTESGISWDYTLAGFTCLHARLEEGCALLADMVRRPAFPQNEVERIREERLSGLAQTRADPGSMADELLARHVFAEGVPFGRRLGGLAATLGSLTRADVEEFHAERYRPAGATLIAAGDVSLEEVAALAERHFGDWAGGADAGRAATPDARFDAATIVLADRPEAAQAEVRVGHRGIPRSSDDYFAAVVLNAILGGTFGSRLNMELRERRGVTYGVSSAFVMRRSFGTFQVSAGIQSEAAAASVAEVLRSMEAIRETAVSPAELDDARSFLAGVFPLGLQTTDGMASRLATLVSYDLPDAYWDGYRERILAVGADDVLDAARRLLQPDRAVVVVVGDAAQLRPALEALRTGPVMVVDPADVLT